MLKQRLCHSNSHTVAAKLTERVQIDSPSARLARPADVEWLIDDLDRVHVSTRATQDCQLRMSAYATSGTSPKKRKLWIDCDAGVDDAQGEHRCTVYSLPAKVGSTLGFTDQIAMQLFCWL